MNVRAILCPLVMSALYIILLIILVVVCLLLLLLVLMQRPRQEGLGAAFGVDVTSQMFGSRTTDVLQKGTVYLSVALFILCVSLGLLNAHESKRAARLGTSIADLPAPAVTPAPEAPGLGEANSPAVAFPGSTPGPEGVPGASTPPPTPDSANPTAPETASPSVPVETTPSAETSAPAEPPVTPALAPPADAPVEPTGDTPIEGPSPTAPAEVPEAPKPN